MDLWFPSDVSVCHGDRVTMVRIELSLFVEAIRIFFVVNYGVDALGFYGQQKA